VSSVVKGFLKEVSPPGTQRGVPENKVISGAESPFLYSPLSGWAEAQPSENTRKLPCAVSRIQISTAWRAITVSKRLGLAAVHVD
jgi:hypothetical protein